MIFNSLTFLMFLVVVVCAYWILPRRTRLWMLFLGSITFYGFWRIEFIPLLLFSSTTDYIVAQRLHVCRKQSTRKLLLLLSLSVNLGLLFGFKYLGFFIDNVWQGLELLGIDSSPPVLNIILPLGISFYTFQTISYTIDVYRGFIKPERDYVLYSCYVMFFPQLVAGPILRAGEVISQLDQRPQFKACDLAEGLRRILFGLFLKVVLADNLAPVVDGGFSNPVEMLGALDIWTLAFLFGFQIYFDFSAYSHIAIGSARLMGIHFPENFNFPYLSVSPREFWRRWHISLSSWIRDYLYLPLAGSTVHDRSTGGLAEAVQEKQLPKRTTWALFLTWAIMGLWHGAAWAFVFWGLWHAGLIYVYRLSAPLRKKLPSAIRIGVGRPLTLGLVMLAWIPFRADGLSNVVGMLTHVVSPSAYVRMGLRENIYLVAAIVTLLVVIAKPAWVWIAPWLDSRPLLRLPLETSIYAVAISLVFIFLRPIQQFIYFQF